MSCVKSNKCDAPHPKRNIACSQIRTFQSVCKCVSVCVCVCVCSVFLKRNRKDWTAQHPRSKGMFSCVLFPCPLQDPPANHMVYMVNGPITCVCDGLPT